MIFFFLSGRDLWRIWRAKSSLAAYETFPTFDVIPERLINLNTHTTTHTQHNTFSLFLFIERYLGYLLKKKRWTLTWFTPHLLAGRKEMQEGSASGRVLVLLGVWHFAIFTWFLNVFCRMHQAITSAQIAHWFTVGAQFANIRITNEVKKEAEPEAAVR